MINTTKQYLGFKRCSHLYAKKINNLNTTIKWIIKQQAYEMGPTFGGSVFQEPIPPIEKTRGSCQYAFDGEKTEVSTTSKSSF